MSGIFGLFQATIGAQVVQAAAHGAPATGAGFAWLVNEASTMRVMVHEIYFASQLGSALAAPTSPRITCEKFTFTGSPSGAVVAMTKLDTRYAPANQSSLRTASTGLTITAGNVLAEFFPTASATAVGYAPPAFQFWRPPKNLGRTGALVLAPGEGLLVRQPDAGTAADTRRFVTSFLIEEYDAP